MSTNKSRFAGALIKASQCQDEGSALSQLGFRYLFFVKLTALLLEAIQIQCLPCCAAILAQSFGDLLGPFWALHSGQGLK